ncbi:DUF2577 family protein [Paenibacillus popilliae]|uniref:Uncharacterized protein n=1 Tax=Paenibacillus popilliae ATCC 14706 TaxID=1212764 RepID=M9LGW1_PAEPP|nr:DUF2577 family protein [Paenibacillus popilliae]GAC41910.1 hypothetical protein PPOP_1267 [Paenibacillus popilliae ATCC 14706]
MLSDCIKKIAQSANDEAVPMKIMFGSVKNTSPLEVLVDNRFVVDDDMLIVPGGVTLQVGDRAILLRDAGGQQFLVMGRLGDANTA